MGAVCLLVTAWTFSAGHDVAGYALGSMLTLVATREHHGYLPSVDHLPVDSRLAGCAQCGTGRMTAMMMRKHIVMKDIAMELRANFARREVVLPDAGAWQPMAIAGAQRYLLSRIGGEVARETSIIRYAAGAHALGGADEFLVLAGSFHAIGGGRGDPRTRSSTDVASDRRRNSR
jgi:hypothetical protein